MKIELDYVDVRRSKGKTYYYFRKGVDKHGMLTSPLIPLPGQPGAKEFTAKYDDACKQYAPHLLKRKKARRTGEPAKDSIIKVIEHYKAKEGGEWEGTAESTREIYDRRFNWLIENFGYEPIWAFDREMMKDIRDHKDFIGRPSVADAVVSRFATLWDYAEEFMRIPELRDFHGVNPARNIKKLKGEDVESAPLWPLTLCEQFEAHRNRDAVTFYYLARYTGQRRSDLVGMEWEHIDNRRQLMFVAQVKTHARIWVPMPKRLQDYLATLPGPHTGLIVKSAKTGDGWLPTSVTNEFARITAELGFATTDSKGRKRTFSPHGLRHLCGVELAHAGASDKQIAAVLGHSTMKQVQTYTKQAEQVLLAKGAQDLRDAMYERERLEALIDAADNVARLQFAA